MSLSVRGVFQTLTLVGILLFGMNAFAQAPDKEFTIAIGESLTFNARGVTRVAVGLEKIASVKPSSDQRQLFLTGISPGVTTVNIFSDRGQKTLLVRVVPVNPEALAQEVRDVMGERSGVDVRVVKGKVLLEGEVASEVFKIKIAKLAELYPNQVLNFTQFREAFVEGARMVALDVHFVQIATSQRDRIGVHWGQFFGANYSIGFGDVPLYYDAAELGDGVLPGEANPTRLPRALGLTGGSGTDYFSLVGNLNAALDLIESVGLIRTVQTGTIVTETGTEAEYHSGGTINVPLSGGLNEPAEIGKIPYGLRMKVTPVLDFENKVKLTLDAEITELDYANAVRDVPATRDNKIIATVNMVEGQSVLVMTQENISDTSGNQGIFLLGRIPFLGYLFKGRTKLNSETNNAFFVTPRLYEAGGKTHRTMVQGVFERLLEKGAEPSDLPELENAQSSKKSSGKKAAKKPKKKAKKEKADKEKEDAK